MFHSTVVFSLLWLVSSTSINPDTVERIVGGDDTTIAAHPYQVSLQLDKNHFCGGSIYSPTIIVTAAHCIKAVQSVDLSRLRVRLGSRFWDSGGQLRNFSNMKIHPNYNPNTMVNDVALVKLAAPVEYTNKIQRIALQQNEPVNGAPGVVSGWGTLKSGANSLPTTLQAVKVQLILQAECNARPNLYSNAIKSTMLCAGDNGKDSCQGDSGGPLVSINTGKLVGIVSWGYGCATKGYPGVYTKVPSVREWIINTAPTLETQ